MKYTQGQSVQKIVESGDSLWVYTDDTATVVVTPDNVSANAVTTTVDRTDGVVKYGPYYKPTVINVTATSLDADVRNYEFIANPTTEGEFGEVMAATGGMNANEVGDAIRNGLTPKSLAELSAYTGMSDGDTAYLSLGGRSGDFIWTLGDFSAEVAADTLQGVYVESDTVAATVGVWKRKLDGYVTPEMFGQSGEVGTIISLIAENTSLRIFLNSDSELVATLPSDFDFSIFYGNGSINIKCYNPLLSTDAARAISFVFRPENGLSISDIYDKMTNGDSVKIVCYGDSTTAGVATTGYTSNTISESQAAGVSDETANSPNAFPYLMIQTLRDMYQNSNIDVFNSGYSGQSIANGWAARNYASAILNNPDIGVSDCCLLQFGLNDVNLEAYSVDLFYAATESLVSLMIGSGTLPILVTSDPSSTGAGSNRNNNRMLALDNVKREIAEKHKIPLLDNHKEIKRFMSNNLEWIQGDEQYRWAKIQNDGTHVNDTGHAFKSGFFCAQLYSGTVYIENDSEYIATWDARVNTIADFDDSNSSPNKNTRVHKSAYIPSCQASTNLMRMYVYNTDLNARVFYRGVGNEGYSGGGGTYPRIVTEHITTLKTQSDLIIRGALQSTETSYSSSETPYDSGKLGYGLNLVRYVSGSVGPYDAYIGSFEIAKNCENHESRNVISGFSSRSSSNAVVLTDHIIEKSVCIPSSTIQALRLKVDCIIPQGCGIILWSAQNYDGTTASWQNNRTLSVALIRNLDDSLSIKLIRHDISSMSIVSETTIATSSILTITDDVVSKLIVVNAATTGQRWRIYNGPSLAGSILMDSTVLYADSMAPWAGVVGGSYHASGATEVHIKSIDVYVAR